MEQKRKCSTCQIELPLHSFHRNRKMPLGRVYNCRDCRKKETQVSPEQLEVSLKERDERLRELGKSSKGRLWSEAHRKKMAIGASNRWTQEDLNESRAKVVYYNYKRRGYKNDFESFKEITQQNCKYCGIGPSIVSKGCRDKRVKFVSRIGIYKYNSIDRVDNDKGYIKGNMVPCCDICNKAKRNLPLETFLAWIERFKK